MVFPAFFESGPYPLMFTVFLLEKIIASNRVYLGVILEYPNWFMLQ